MKNNIKVLSIILAFIALPFISKAQFGGPFPSIGNAIKITYSGRVSSPGANGSLRVTTNTGATHDYTTFPSSYDFSSSFSSLTLDFSHGMHPGWGNTYYLVTISKSTLNAQAAGSTVNYYMPNVNRYYQITKGYGYSVVGQTYDYTLDVKVREPYL